MRNSAKKAEAGSHTMDKEGHEPCVLAAGKSAIEDVAGNLIGQVTADGIKQQ